MMMNDWPHGDVSDAQLRELGADPSAVVDFAVNVDPRGPHPKVREAYLAADISRYPDPHARELKAALARRDAVPVSHVAVGAGVTGILWSSFRAAPRGARVLVPAHTFHEYTAAAEAAQLQVDTLPRHASENFAIDWDQVDAWMRGPQAHAFILGSPDNPSGIVPDYAALERLASRHPERVVLVDEAFLRLSIAHEQIFAPLPPNVVRLRALTKELGMPGLRIGYAIGHPSQFAGLKAQTPPWSVSSPAMAAALAGVADPSIVNEARTWMRASLVELHHMLRRAGFEPGPTSTVYTLMPVDDAAAWRAAMLRRAILVRDCSSFGLPHHLRLCGRDATDRARLLSAFAEVRRESKS